MFTEKELLLILELAESTEYSSIYFNLKECKSLTEKVKQILNKLDESK